MYYTYLLPLLLALTAASPLPQAGGGNPESISLAIAENRLFQTLAASSHCDATAQPNACINGEFSQCVAGAFSQGTQCAGELECFSLPLVNRVGTSVTCTTPEDAAARMGFDSVGALQAAFGDAVSVAVEMQMEREREKRGLETRVPPPDKLAELGKGAGLVGRVPLSVSGVVEGEK